MQAKWAKAWRPERQQIPSDRDRLVQMWNNLATLLATHPIVSTEILRDMTRRRRGLRPRLVEPALLQQMIGTSSLLESKMKGMWWFARSSGMH